MFISIIMFIFVAEVNHRYHFCRVRSRTPTVHGKSTRRKFRKFISVTRRFYNVYALCICVNIFKFFNNMAPDYTSEIFHPSHSRHNTRMSTYKLDLPFRKNVHGQKTLSYLGPKTWNSLPAQIKLCKNVNNFKHDIKNLYFKRLQKSDDSIFMYY